MGAEPINFPKYVPVDPSIPSNESDPYDIDLDIVIHTVGMHDPIQGTGSKNCDTFLCTATCMTYSPDFTCFTCGV